MWRGRCVFQRHRGDTAGCNPARPRCRAARFWLPLMWVTSAPAQGFIWGGVGSTTATTDYNLGTNWNPPAGAPPVAAGQSAVFDATGSVAVVVTAGPVSPGSWTINATSQSYSISGAAVNFNLAGATGGIINNANAGQTISISNNIGESVASVKYSKSGSAGWCFWAPIPTPAGP